jgi:hydrogenase/urease accessory protein HupE
MQAHRFSLQGSLQTLLLFFVIVFSNLASAHEIQPSIVDFTFNKAGYYQLSIQTNLEALLAQVGSQHQDTSSSDNANKYNQLRNITHDKLNDKFKSFSTEFLNKVQLDFDGKTQQLNILDVEIPEIGDTELVRESVINIAGLIPENTKTMSWRWDPAFGNAVLRVSSEDNPELYSAYLTDGKKSDLIAIGIDCSDPEIAKKKVPECATKSGQWEAIKNYLQVGFVHIVPKGLDHILFVVGLFLLSTQLRPLLIQITSFTLAHTASLAMGIYGIVSVPASIVEPLIAASIFYVAIENIFSSKLSRWRPILVFLFGLLHGLGFASVLTEIGLSSTNFVTSLIAFNVGVELGQLVVIAVCFAVVGFWFGKKDWYRSRITIPFSIVIAFIASYWFFERIGVIGA